jgi:hypothetical protein
MADPRGRDRGPIDDEWELDAGIVRPYLFTQGRTKPTSSVDLPVEAMVSSTPLARATSSTLPAEQRRIIDCCGSARSVAELAAEVRAPLTVVRVLVADLYTIGMLDVHRATDVADDIGMLQRMIERVKAIA